MSVVVKGLDLLAAPVLPTDEPKEYLPLPRRGGIRGTCRHARSALLIGGGDNPVKTCTNCFFEAPDSTRFCPNCGHVLPMPAPKKDDRHGLIGKTIAGKFVVHDCIGQGAMGSIYRAEQVNLGKQVCIKVLHPHLVGDYELSKRFHREAKAASRLHHPNAINIIDFGTSEEGIHYIAMDFLQGRDLAHLLKDEYPLEPLRILYLVDQVCSALDEAHAQGIIHRDLKPENIMVEDRRHQKDFVTVLDFGIAKIIEPEAAAAETFHTRAGIVCGTPEYMSPEQAQGLELDARTDIYSLGIILYQLNTKKLPFTGETPIGVVTKHLTQVPVRPRELNPDIDPAMEELILRLMAKNRNDRPASAMEVRALIDGLRKRLSQPVPAAGPEVMTQPSFGIPNSVGRPLRTEPLATPVRPGQAGAATGKSSGGAASTSVASQKEAVATTAAGAVVASATAAAQPTASQAQRSASVGDVASISIAQDAYSGVKAVSDQPKYRDSSLGGSGQATTKEQDAIGHFQTMQGPKTTGFIDEVTNYPSPRKRVAILLLVMGTLAVLGVGAYVVYDTMFASHSGQMAQRSQTDPAVQPGANQAAVDAAAAEADARIAAEREAAEKARQEADAAEAARLAKEEEERQAEAKAQQQKRVDAAILSVKETKEAYNTFEMKLKLRKEVYILANRPDRVKEIDDLVAVAVSAKGRLDALIGRMQAGPLDESMENESAREKADFETLSAKAAPLFTEVLANPNAAAAQKKIEAVGQRISEQRTTLADLRKRLGDKALEWDKARNKKKATELEELSKQLEAVDAELAALLKQVSADNVDRMGEEIGRIRGKSETLLPRVESALAETVVVTPEVVVKPPVTNQGGKEPVTPKQPVTPKDPGGSQANQNGNQNNNQNTQPPVDNSAEARKLEALGDQEIQQGNYTKGIVYLRESLKLVKSPNVVKKLGQAYNNKGDYKQGADYLRMYLKMMEGKLSPTAVQLIEKQIRSD